MYSQFLYFIVALTLFTIQEPGAQAPYPPWQTLTLCLTAFVVYVLICFLAFGSLKRLAWQDSSSSILTHRYHRIQNRLYLLSIGFLAFYVYVLNIKFYLLVQSGLDQSLTLSGIAGLGIFMLHLAVIWFWAHPIYQRIHHSDIKRGAFIKGQFSFVSAILIPWFFISLASDLLQFVKLPGFLGAELGEFLFLGMVLVCLVLFSPLLVVRLWGCTPLPHTPVRQALDAFCLGHRFAVGDFLLWPLFGGEILTAGIIGILARWRYILITRGLLALLDGEELKAVVAHEIGHVRRLHLLMYLLFLVCFSVLVYAYQDLFFMFFLRYEVLLRWVLSPEKLPLTVLSLISSIPVLVLLVLHFRYVFGFFLRNSERQADLYALQLIGHPFTLISSLKKIAFYSGRIEDLPSWHHFSIRERIDFLLSSYENPQIIRKHDRKLYGSAVFFLVVVSSLSAFGFHLAGTKMVESWRNDLEMRIVEKELARRPDSHELYAAYGGLLFETGRYAEAESVLRKAHENAPLNANVMNNLAWLYATSPPPYFKPQEALTLAQKAADLDPAPYVLDTLAEAYYANGRYKEALETIEKAIEANPEKPDHYLQQKEKFEEALRRG